jgi:hypothetical protein
MPADPSNILKKPEKKDGKFIAKAIAPVKIFFTDVKLKSIRRLIDNKGYNITLYIPENINGEDLESVANLDDSIMKEIIASAPKWFSKTLTQSELEEMYNRSFCSQTKTLSAIFTNTKNPTLIYNNKNVESVDNVISILREDNHFKKCIINVELEYHGIYFYADNTRNKWVISSVDITDISSDNANNEWINKEDVIDKLNDNINVVNKKMGKRVLELQKYINTLEENRLNINKLFLELKECPHNNIQEPLNKLNQMIIYQEGKIINQ